MIHYNHGFWGISFLWQRKGSVFPKTLCWSLPSAFFAVLVNVCAEQEIWNSITLDGFLDLWGGYTAILGFLVIFRNNLAYNRFWEGATLISQIRGEWTNAVSSLVAFSSHDKAMRLPVLSFQHLLVRLMSMLHCAALQQVADVEDDCFDIISPEGMDQLSIEFLVQCDDRCEVLLQWIQRLIVQAGKNGLLEVEPPILSRVYQELSRGIVKLHDVRKLKELPFPFPYAQMTTTMMLIHYLLTPIIAGQYVKSALWAALICFCIVSALWGLMYIALELENPFGEDENDLDVGELQCQLNRTLAVLLEPRVQSPPGYIFDADRDGWCITDRSHSYAGRGSQDAAQRQSQHQGDRRGSCAEGFSTSFIEDSTVPAEMTKVKSNKRSPPNVKEHVYHEMGGVECRTMSMGDIVARAGGQPNAGQRNSRHSTNGGSVQRVSQRGSVDSATQHRRPSLDSVASMGFAEVSQTREATSVRSWDEAAGALVGSPGMKRTIGAGRPRSHSTRARSEASFRSHQHVEVHRVPSMEKVSEPPGPTVAPRSGGNGERPEDGRAGSPPYGSSERSPSLVVRFEDVREDGDRGAAALGDGGSAADSGGGSSPAAGGPTAPSAGGRSYRRQGYLPPRATADGASHGGTYLSPRATADGDSCEGTYAARVEL